jgi:predicted peptidase
MGGGGAWAQGATMNQIWAGIGPISGWYRAVPAPPAEGLKDLAIYCLHGEKDEAVTVERSRLAVKDLTKIGMNVLELKEPHKYNKIGEEKFVYREVPGAPHNVMMPWEQGSKELGLMMSWLLCYQREKPADLDAAAKALAVWGKQSFKWSYDGVLGSYGPAVPTTAPATAPKAP